MPTVPAGWLTFAEGVVYSAYDHAEPLWGISPTDDQQAAGAVMKVIGGFYLWALHHFPLLPFCLRTPRSRSCGLEEPANNPLQNRNVLVRLLSHPISRSTMCSGHSMRTPSPHAKPPLDLTPLCSRSCSLRSTPALVLCAHGPLGRGPGRSGHGLVPTRRVSDHSARPLVTERR